MTEFTRGTFNVCADMLWNLRPVLRDKALSELATIEPEFLPFWENYCVTHHAAWARVFRYGAYSVRVVMQDGQAWFVAWDLFRALPNGFWFDATRVKCLNLEEWRRVRIRGGHGQQVFILNGVGLQKLVARYCPDHGEEVDTWVETVVIKGKYPAR